MWPGFGSILGGSNGLLPLTDPRGDIPTSTFASGIYTPDDASFYLTQQFQGTNWPTIADPSFSNVKTLIHMDEHSANGNVRMLPPSASPNDGDALEGLTGNGGALFRATRKFGLYAWQGIAVAQLRHNINTNITVGTGDVTAEGWVYLNNSTGVGVIWDMRTGVGDTVHNLLRTNAGKLSLFRNGLVVVEDTNVMSNAVWHHFAWCRDTVAGKSYLYLDGVSVGTPATDATNYTASGNYHIGLSVATANPLAGFLDEFRLTVGTARYSGGTTFTVPVLPFPDY